jgi:hypothetical protein
MPTDDQLKKNLYLSEPEAGPGGLDVESATKPEWSPEELQNQRLLATGREEAVAGAFRFIAPLIPPSLLATSGAAAMQQYLQGKARTLPGTAAAGLAEAERADEYWRAQRKAADVEHRAAVKESYAGRHLPSGDPVADALEQAEWEAKQARDVTGRFDDPYPRNYDFVPPDRNIAAYNRGKGPSPIPPAEPVRDTPTIVQENLDVARARAKVADPSGPVGTGSYGTTTQASQVGARGVAAAERAIGSVLGLGASLAAAAPITVATEVQRSKDFEVVLRNMALDNLQAPIPKGMLSKETLTTLKEKPEVIERLYRQGVLSYALYQEIGGGKEAVASR